MNVKLTLTASSSVRLSFIIMLGKSGQTYIERSLKTIKNNYMTFVNKSEL